MEKLLGVEDAINNPEKQVLILENFESWGAASVKLHSVCVVAHPRISYNYEEIDLTPLKNRKVIVWQENKNIKGLCKKLAAIGAHVRFIVGVADWHASAEEIIAYAKSVVVDWSEENYDKDLALATSEAPSPSPPPPPPQESWEPDTHLVDALKQVIQPLTSAIVTKIPTPRKKRAKEGNVVSFHSDIPPPKAGDDFRQRLIFDADGMVKPKLTSNFRCMINMHPDMAGVFRWNDIAGDVFLLNKPPWGNENWKPRAMVEGDIVNTIIWLEHQGLTPKKNDARDVIRGIALENKYNPIRDYLDALVWDGVPRLQGGMYEGESIDPLSVEYMGAPSNPIFGKLVTKWHIAAVARAYKPGTKVDSMIVLEGTQSRYKSTYLRIMATINGIEYFADSVGDITSANSIMLLQGCWLVEIAELAGLQKREVQHIKAWLSRTTDAFVPKYESQRREVPRNYVIAGTHNPSGHGYLKDPTGERRFWPVPINKIEIQKVTRDRDQIWAEAVTLYKQGVTHWLDAAESLELDKINSERQVSDPWVYKIDETLRGCSSVSMIRLIESLGIPIAQQNEATVRRIGEHLYKLGFREKKKGEWHTTFSGIDGNAYLV